jgi:hypothetical protein
MRTPQPQRNLWDRVHNHITQPVGWLLFSGGVAVWMALLVIEWFRSGELTLRWMATTAIGIGYEQFREWRHSPYKDLDR